MKLIMLAAGQKAVPATHTSPHVSLNFCTPAAPFPRSSPSTVERTTEEEDVAERHFSRRRARSSGSHDMLYDA